MFKTIYNRDIPYFCFSFCLLIFMSEKSFLPYINDYYNRERLQTIEVKIGDVKTGSDHPIRVQSMTTADTMDTKKSVEESIRMIENGCEIVRLTAPSKKEAENLAIIKQELLKKGHNTPLVADIHFTPNAAEIAAKYVEKVRINPGNYADKKKFEEIDYSESSYQDELNRIEEKFTPLVKICKENGVAMRIGTNHGSLSDRILSRYGDTPKGMVESALEFLRICQKNDFHAIVLSMKASNTVIMVQAYRLLVAKMLESGNVYPIHLGVTEAGDGEDGRIKSAVGIGALLEDGIGDTIRVSLTEKPEAEIPVAQKLLKKYSDVNQTAFKTSKKTNLINYNPYEYNRRVTNEIKNIGGHKVPVVFADLSTIKNIKHSHLFGFGYNYSVPLDKWNINDAAADYVYIGSQEINFELPGTLAVVCDFENWNKNYRSKAGFYPIVTTENVKMLHVEQFAFIVHDATNANIEYIKTLPNTVIILESNFTNNTQLYRNIYNQFIINNIKNPVILSTNPKCSDAETYQLWSSADIGSLLIDGFGDGIWLKGNQPTQIINSTSFGILQATRTRISKTEYISCPSCGRTLFDLQETTAKIRSKTAHLKGLKIGIMGCIVNGPGEMADADYGYVGTGPGKIHLYKEKTVMKKNVSEDKAVEALIELIKENGDWIDEK